MPTEKDCMERRLSDRKEIYAAIGDRTKWRTFIWIVAGIASLLAVVYGLSIMAYGRARNNETALARVDERTQRIEQTQQEQRGDIKEILDRLPR
jgi:hypothetical protein